MGRSSSSRTDAEAGTTIDDATVTDAASGRATSASRCQGPLSESSVRGSPGVSFGSSDPHADRCDQRDRDRCDGARRLFELRMRQAKPDRARHGPVVAWPSTGTTARPARANELHGQHLHGLQPGRQRDHRLQQPQRAAQCQQRHHRRRHPRARPHQIWSCQAVPARRQASPPTRTASPATVTVTNSTRPSPARSLQNQDVGTRSVVPAYRRQLRRQDHEQHPHVPALVGASQVPSGVVPTANGNSVTIQPSQRMRWSDILPGVAPGKATDTDIVPWGMNGVGHVPGRSTAGRCEPNNAPSAGR